MKPTSVSACDSPVRCSGGYAAPCLEFDARLPGGVTFGVAEVTESREVIWVQRNEVGNPVLCDLAATIFDLFATCLKVRVG